MGPQGDPASSSCCSEGAESCALNPYALLGTSPVPPPQNTVASTSLERVPSLAAMHCSLLVCKAAVGGKGMSLLSTGFLLAKVGGCCFTLS